MKITQRRLKQIIKEELETALDEGGCGNHAAPEVMMADDEPVHSDNPLDALAQIIAGLMGQQEEPMMYEADDEKDEEYVNPKVDPYERALEAPLQEAEGKGCAESEGGSGCIKKRGDQWVVLNNKKGGVWRKCDSRSHCEEILDAFHASRG